MLHPFLREEQDLPRKFPVLFPSGEVVRIGNMELIAIPLDDRVTLSINKEPKEITLKPKGDDQHLHVEKFRAEFPRSTAEVRF